MRSPCHILLAEASGDPYGIVLLGMQYR